MPWRSSGTARPRFTNRDGGPLLHWHQPEDAWNDFIALTKGRSCDQPALAYERLRSSGGIQWPCTESSPDGTERLYTDHVFPTAADRCEDYAHDLATGAQHEADECRLRDPAGRAILKAAHYLPPHEPPDENYPLLLTTGRGVTHWHTRTKTARVPELNDAAPDMWVELHPDDAHGRDIAEGDRPVVVSGAELDATDDVSSSADATEPPR